MTVRDIDHGWGALAKEVQAQRGGYVTVGVQGAGAAARHRGAKDLTVVQIATIHEFGATVRMPDGHEIEIPERSFLRATVDEHRAELTRTAAACGRAMLLGKLARKQALGLLGEKAIALIKKRIADGIAPANSPITIARKKSSKPLIDQGQLRGSITYEVADA
jgi:hypothetical protein